MSGNFLEIYSDEVSDTMYYGTSNYNDKVFEINKALKEELKKFSSIEYWKI